MFIVSDSQIYKFPDFHILKLPINRKADVMLIFIPSDPEAQHRGGLKADISETFRSTFRGCGGGAPANLDKF